MDPRFAASRSDVRAAGAVGNHCGEPRRGKIYFALERNRRLQLKQIGAGKRVLDPEAP